MRSSAGPDVEKRYTGRAAGIVPMGISLDRDAARILREHAPSPKAYGRFLSRLLFEHEARQEERRRVRQAVATALETA